MERVFKRYFNSHVLFNFLQIIIFMYICGIKNKITTGLPWWLRCWRIHLQFRTPGFDPWDREIPWRRKWQPTLVFLPGKYHGQRNLAGYSPWGCKESDITGWPSTHTHIITKAKNDSPSLSAAQILQNLSSMTVYPTAVICLYLHIPQNLYIKVSPK